jgi:hypothetical protein
VRDEPLDEPRVERRVHLERASARRELEDCGRRAAFGGASVSRRRGVEARRAGVESAGRAKRQ